MIGLLLGLFAAVVIAALILGSLAVYGSKASHTTRSPATIVVAGDNPSPAPSNTTRIPNVSGVWSYVKPWIKWLTTITVVAVVAVVVFAFVRWEAPNTTDATATNSSIYANLNISDLFTAELLLVGIVVLALAGILLIFRSAGTGISVFGRDLIFLVIVVVMNYTIYHYQLLKTPVFWFVVGIQLLVLSVISKNTRFRLIMLFAFLILVTTSTDRGIERGLTWFDRGFNHGEWSKPTTQTERRRVTEPTTIKAGNSGYIVAPANRYAWLTYEDRCYHWWVVENPEGNLVDTLYRDGLSGKIVPTLPKATMAQGWTSKVGRPVRIEYETSTRRPDGSCKEF